MKNERSWGHTNKSGNRQNYHESKYIRKFKLRRSLEGRTGVRDLEEHGAALVGELVLSGPNGELVVLASVSTCNTLKVVDGAGALSIASMGNLHALDASSDGEGDQSGQCENSEERTHRLGGSQTSDGGIRDSHRASTVGM